MKTRGGKRFRGSDHFDRAGHSSDTCRSNDVPSNEDNGSLNTFPSLASDIFLTNLRDVRLLKTCRLVCLSWNLAACKSLKTCSMVRLDESDSDRLVEFTNVLLGRSCGPLEHLSSPFQNFDAVGISFTDPTFIKLALLPNIAITTLVLSLDNDVPYFDQSQLNLVLASKKATITSLIIWADASFEFDRVLLPNDEINLMSLKSLHFTDSCDHCMHIPLMESMLSECKPTSVILNIHDEKLLISLLLQDKIENLVYLKLEFVEISTEGWKHLRQLRFLKLRSLTLKACYPTNEPDYILQLSSFLQNVSPHLRYLETNFAISESKFQFPNLKVVSVSNNPDLSGFIPDRFPSLLTVIYKFENSLLTAPKSDVTSHRRVLSVTIDIIDDTKNPSFDQDLLVSLTYLSQQFPTVFHVKVSMQKFRCTTLADICESFPYLMKLDLDGECDFCSFSGISSSTLIEYLELGRPIEKIPRRKSILDFLILQEISFGPKFFVHPDMLIHCLPRIRTLKNVKLHWNGSLSAPLLRNSIGHLEKIVIFSSKCEFQDSMDEVIKIPNVDLR